MVWSLRWGADTDYGFIHRRAYPRDARMDYIRNAPVPIGTVPIYQALKTGGIAEDLT